LQLGRGGGDQCVGEIEQSARISLEVADMNDEAGAFVVQRAADELDQLPLGIERVRRVPRAANEKGLHSGLGPFAVWAVAIVAVEVRRDMPEA
jgi:hypothetical protein